MAIDTTLVSFDYSGLSSYYSTGASLSPSLHAATLRNGVLKDLIAQKNAVETPWSSTAASDKALSERVLNGTGRPLINLSDPSLAREGVTADYKSLFALYQGLSRLRDMAEFVRSDAKGMSLGGVLEKQFQNLLGQYRSYVEGLRFDGGITLIAGLKQESLTSTLTFPKTSASYVGGLASTSRNEPVAGLNGDETFTIRIGEGGSATDIAIDLSEVGGGKSLDDIAAYINDRLAATSGVATRVEVNRRSEFDYRLQVNLSDGETVSFLADAGSRQQPAAYVVGTSGGGDLSGAFLRKFEDLGAAGEATQGFLQRIDTDKADSASSVAVDSHGYVYVVGTTSGDLNGEINGGTDVYLRKYDPSGREIYSRLLGAGDAAGFAVAVDGEDNVIVAGRTTTPLTDLAYGGGSDTFVTKFDASGEELFTRQAAPYASDGALGLTVDAEGNIFVSGYTEAAIGEGAVHGGGKDGFVTKLDAGGTLQYNRQIGAAGDQAANAVAVDDAGSIYVLVNDNGRGVLHKYADAEGGGPVFSVDLGELSGGQATGLARDGSGKIYVTGTVGAASLSGPAGSAYSGGTDVFVTRIDEASGAIDYASYLGSGSDDEAGGIAVADGTIYLAGSTAGSIGGAAKVGDIDGFFARLDGADGTLISAQQFGSGFAHRGSAVVVDAKGTSVLSRLGLPEGELPVGGNESVAALTSARAGQSLTLSIDGGTPTRITLAEGDSLGFFAFRMNQALGAHGVAKIVTNTDGTQSLQIKALDDSRIAIGSGFAGADLLQPLGLKPAILLGTPVDSEAEESAASSTFALGVIDTLSLATQKGASDAYDILDNAMREVRKAYQYLTEGPEEPVKATGAVPAYLQKQIAAYSDALTRISALTGTSA